METLVRLTFTASLGSRKTPSHVFLVLWTWILESWESHKAFSPVVFTTFLTLSPFISSNSSRRRPGIDTFTQLFRPAAHPVDVEAVEEESEEEGKDDGDSSGDDSLQDRAPGGQMMLNRSSGHSSECCHFSETQSRQRYKVKVKGVTHMFGYTVIARSILALN